MSGLSVMLPTHQARLPTVPFTIRPPAETYASLSLPSSAWYGELRLLAKRKGREARGVWAYCCCTAAAVAGAAC